MRHVAVSYDIIVRNCDVLIIITKLNDERKDKIFLIFQISLKTYNNTLMKMYKVRKYMYIRTYTLRIYIRVIL